MHSDAYIVAATRTPVGKANKGVFKHTRPDDLLTHAIKSLVALNPQVDPKEIADVVIGCAMPEAEQGMNVARIATLLAGLPVGVPGVTVNRFCASGIQSIAMAAADRLALKLHVAQGVKGEAQWAAQLLQQGHVAGAAANIKPSPTLMLLICRKSRASARTNAAPGIWLNSLSNRITYAASTPSAAMTSRFRAGG